MKTRLLIVLIALMNLTIACNKTNVDDLVQKPIYFRSTAAPEWARSTGIYRVNIQQYTHQGTFNAFAEHLPHLQEMGVKLLWLMPIHSNATAQGAFYASNSYRPIDPALGTLQDFKKLVQKIHDLDMKIIIDWSPDYTLLKENPNYYTATANPVLPVESPDATINQVLDFQRPALQKRILEEMLFWVNEVAVDGYHCGGAAQIPDDFWLQIMPRLRAAKPDIFMLAGSEYSPYLNLELFSATYGTSFHALLYEIASGKKNAIAIDKWYKEYRATYIAGYHMNYFPRVNEQASDVLDKERFGNAADVMDALVATFEGMPMIHYDNESTPLKQAFYKKLLHLKKHNRALWNGIDGGNLQRVLVDNANVYAFIREKYTDKILVILNLSDDTQIASLEHNALPGTYYNIFDDSITGLPSRMVVELKPWSYMILSSRIDGL